MSGVWDVLRGTFGEQLATHRRRTLEPVVSGVLGVPGFLKLWILICSDRIPGVNGVNALALGVPGFLKMWVLGCNSVDMWETTLNGALEGA